MPRGVIAALSDAIVSSVAPQWGVKRYRARAQMEMLRSMDGSGYGQHGASTSKRSLLGWFTGRGGDPDRDITDNLDTLRIRSRDLYMGGGLGCGAIKTVVTNTVGPGLYLNPQIDAEYLGMSEESASEWERTVEREFYLWAESDACDYSRTCNFQGLQKLAFLSFLMNGDVFALLPMEQRHRTPYRLCVQLIEGDRVCNPDHYDASLDIREGVERNELGVDVAYHICLGHPGAAPLTSEEMTRQHTWKRVPIFGPRTGRRNILHIMDPERIGARRGVPFLAPVIEDLKQLGRYTQAELMAAVVGGMLTVFITSETPEAPPLGEGIPLPSEGSEELDERKLALGYGSVLGLAPGEKAEMTDPKRPTTAFDGFVTAISRQIGTSLGLPYDVLVKAFNASYSASRGALLEAWKTFKVWRSFFVSSFCQPVYEAWLEEAVALGRIQAPGFFDDPMIRKSYCGSEWHGPAQGTLNPLQEANAYKVMVDEDFTTRAAIVAEQNGGDYGRVIRQRAAEERLRREGGLKETPAARPAAVTEKGEE